MPSSAYSTYDDVKIAILLGLAVVLLAVLLIPKIRRVAWTFVGYLLSGGSGEFLLRVRPNGGDVVFVRSVWTSALLVLLAIGLKERLASGATWAFSSANLVSEVRDHLDWLGAAFAATYAAYYARFSSQWTYLAGMYNQIMAAQVQSPRGEVELRERPYTAWWAAFIEDAEDVHLAAKPSYAAVIAGLIGDAEIRRMYESATANGEKRLVKLEVDLVRSLGAAKFNELKQAGSDGAEARLKRLAASRH